MWSLMKLLALLLLPPVLSVPPVPTPVPPVYPNLVSYCVKKNERFTMTETQYVDKRFHPVGEPFLPGPQVEEFQKEVYDKEKTQRVFECISNKTDVSSENLQRLNPEFLSLVVSCKSKQSSPICNPLSKYRTMDGTCNNLVYPKWGSQFSCLNRFLPQRYEGTSGFRQSVCGGPLPEPRTISLEINLDRNRYTKEISNMAVYLGQFVAHDISDIPTTFVSTQPIDCCSHPGKKQHPQCAPIINSKSDPFYSMFNFTCVDFTRAAICDTCDLGKRNQMNQVTSYIDLSTVYGSSDNISRSIRSEEGKGMLKSQYKKEEELLPPDPSLDIFGGCGSETVQEQCFLAADRRVNMHTPLISLHTTFMREHNRIAEHLGKLNPNWDDETLYQESRRINIAQFQVIVYKELLPIIIGPDLMAHHGLDVDGQSLYNPAIKVNLWAEFNTAGYRLHSTISSIVTEYGAGEDARYLRDEFGDAVPIYEGNMTSLVKGICQSVAQQYDKYVVKDMTGYMYKSPKGKYGFDIASVNIQRGRDNGLPTYTEMVNYLSEGRINILTFEQLDSFIDEENIKALKTVYCDVRDIDLWVGLNNEKVKEGMLVGPSAGEIIARQFNVLKNGDRFFFQHSSNFTLRNGYRFFFRHASNFNYNQLVSLKQASFARILCDNTKVNFIQQNALKLPSSSNPVLNCKDIPRVDLDLWATVGL